MYCSNCGTEVKETDIFCAGCGASLKHIDEVTDKITDKASLFEKDISKKLYFIAGISVLACIFIVCVVRFVNKPTSDLSDISEEYETYDEVARLVIPDNGCITDLSYAPNEYIPNFDNISFGMSEEEVINALAVSSEGSLGEIASKDESYNDFISYAFYHYFYDAGEWRVSHDSLGREQGMYFDGSRMYFTKGFEGNNKLEKIYLCKENIISSSEALKMYDSLTDYYQQLPDSSVHYEGESEYTMETVFRYKDFFVMIYLFSDQGSYEIHLGYSTKY